jgi:hypothetical protein
MNEHAELALQLLQKMSVLEEVLNAVLEKL